MKSVKGLKQIARAGLYYIFIWTFFRKKLDKYLRNGLGRDDPAMGQTDKLEEFFKSHATLPFQLFSLVPTFSALGNNRIKKSYLIASFLNTVQF